MKVEKYDKYYSFLTVGNRPNTNHTQIERRAVEHMKRDLFMLNTKPNIKTTANLYIFFICLQAYQAILFPFRQKRFSRQA